MQVLGWAVGIGVLCCCVAIYSVLYIYIYNVCTECVICYVQAYLKLDG